MQKMAQSSLFELGDVIVRSRLRAFTVSQWCCGFMSPRKGFSPCAILG